MMVAPAQRVVGFPLSSSAEAGERGALSSSAEAKAAWYQPQRSLLSEELLATAALEGEESYSDTDSDSDGEEDDWQGEGSEAGDPEGPTASALMQPAVSSSGTLSSQGSLDAEPRLKRQRSNPVPIAISE